MTSFRHPARAVLRPAVVMLGFVTGTACSDGALQPTSIESEALVASAPDWQPADITQGLQVDAATREQIDAAVRTLHASLLDLHARYETARTLAGAEREAYRTALEADLQTLHEEHEALWSSLDPGIRSTLAARIHAQMDAHDDGSMQTLHERMRRLHGGAHDAAGSGR